MGEVIEGGARPFVVPGYPNANRRHALRPRHPARLHRARASPENGRGAAGVLGGVGAVPGRFHTAQRRPIAASRRPASADRRLVAGAARPTLRRGGADCVSQTDRLFGRRAPAVPDRYGQYRSGNRRPGRPAIGGAGLQRPLCPQRRQCALGQFVRRPLRHRRPDAADRGQRLRSRARGPSDRLRARVPGPRGAAGDGIARRRGRLYSVVSRPDGASEGRRRDGSGRARSVRRLSRLGERAQRDIAGP